MNKKKWEKPQVRSLKIKTSTKVIVNQKKENSPNWS